MGDGGRRIVAPDGDGDVLTRALQLLVADATVARAAGDRMQERSLREVAESEATIIGIAVDLAERETDVVVRTRAVRSHRGRIVAVGRDLLVLRDAERPPVIVATSAVTTIRSATGVDGRPWGPDAAGSRPAPLEVRMAGLLARLGSDRPRVQVGIAGEEAVTGELRSVGSDVLGIRLDHQGRSVVHVHLDAVSDVVLLDV